MRDHPIPQDVVGYKFHIVGNMTLKQFAEVALGVVIAVIIYNTNLIGIVKWTLIILSAGFGVIIAFVPIEERPLDHWITTFFKIIYNPTKYYWKKETEIPFAFTHQKREKTKEEEAFEIDLTPARRQRIKEYLSSVGDQKPTDSFDDEENIKIRDVLALYENVQVTEITATPRKVKPNLVPKVRNLAKKSQDMVENSENIIFQQQQQTNKKIEIASADKTILQPVPETIPINKTIEIPKETISTNESLPFPKQPTTPNTIVGMVLTQDNKLVDQAVITIKTTQGQVVSSLKTNLLGQFSLSTALPNGTYIISVEKTDFQFTEKTLTLSGKSLHHWK